MRILWKYFRPQQGLVVVALLLAALAQLLTLIDPIIFGKIIDEFAGNPKRLPQNELVRQVVNWLAIALAVALTARGAKAIQEYFTRKAVQKFGMQIFNDGIKQTLRLSFQEFEEQRSGETLSILQKVKTDTEKFVNAFITILFSSLVGVAFLVWYSITRNGLLVPVFALGILVLGSLTGLMSKKIKTVQRTITRQTNKMAGVITESLRNIELVKSLGLTFPEIRRLNIQTQKIYELEMMKASRVRSLSFLQGTLLSVLKQSILFILLWLIFRQQLSTGELISMQFISTSLFVPLQDLGTIILNYREVESSLTNFNQLMQKPIERRPEQPVDVGPLHKIEFNDVVFRHRTAGFHAIDHLSLTITEGQTVAFVGPSGSGKSTIVKLLVGLYRPLSGQVCFNNVAAQEIRYNELRRQIGFVTQETQLFAGTIKENLQFVKADATEEEMMNALHRASCDGLLSKSSEGINTMLGEGGMKLSGGEKQRISIARALLRQPRLLIFDEATSALDSITEEEITSTIRDVSSNQNQICILIAHRLSTIMHADRIYVLEKGTISEQGAHQELLQKKGLYYALWRQQIGERRN